METYRLDEEMSESNVKDVTRKGNDTIRGKLRVDESERIRAVRH